MKPRPQIEISLDLERRPAAAGLLAAGLLLFIAAYIGRYVTPAPARLLGWHDWTALKVERQYRAELDALRGSAGELAAALDAPPDPVRGGLLHDRVAQRHHTGLAALGDQRGALLAANAAVYRWSAGAAGREAAEPALLAALERLK